MSKKTRVVLLAACLGIAATSVLFCVAYSRWRATPQRREAARLARLNQRISGFATDDEVRGAHLRMTRVHNFGGYLFEWQYADGKLIYTERRGMPGTSRSSRSLPLTEAHRQLLSDIVNLIKKQKLWDQADQSQPVTDGGEDAYEFTVGGRHGKFKLVNTSPPHLDIFEHKCRKLLELSKKQAKVPVPPSKAP